MEIILPSAVLQQLVGAVAVVPASMTPTMDATAHLVVVVEVTLEGVNLASPWEMHRPIGNTRAMMVGQGPTTMVETVAAVELEVLVVVQQYSSSNPAVLARLGG
jgi:hypothetical protein